MFKKIVLATDGSRHAMKAAAIAADIAATYGAQLTIINVLPSALSLADVSKAPQARKFDRKTRQEIFRVQRMVNQSPGDEALYRYIPAFERVRSELSRRIIDDAERVARAREVKNIVRVSDTGDAAKAIVQHVKKAKSDLVVLGARGLGGFAALVFGSVSRKVNAAVKCPSLIVK
jgi:nucleotide-binding universal stress UspA family protein